MLAFHPQMFVRIKELHGPRAPMPKPLDSGFSVERLYRVLGVYSPSETSDAYFILANDRDELWFICQRHLRFAGLFDTPGHHLSALGADEHGDARTSQARPALQAEGRSSSAPISKRTKNAAHAG